MHQEFYISRHNVKYANLQKFLFYMAAEAVSKVIYNLLWYIICERYIPYLFIWSARSHTKSFLSYLAIYSFCTQIAHWEYVCACKMSNFFSSIDAKIAHPDVLTSKYTTALYSLNSLIVIIVILTTMSISFLLTL